MPVKRPGGWLMVTLLSIISLGASGRDVRLVEAVKKADEAAVRVLLQQRADANTPETDGMTALHWAAQLDALETANLLIRAGANVKATNRFGVTPLSLACTNGNAAMIETLLKAGADPNSASPEGETALMTAARTGKVDALKVLLAHGADANATEGWKHQTALMWVAAENHVAAVDALIEAGADIHARSKAGFSPLMLAVRSGYIEAVRVLLAAGADVNETVPNGPLTDTSFIGGRFAHPADKGATTSALALAIINANYEIAALLLDKGADPNAPDPRGSLLHALAWMRRPGSGNNPLPTGNVDTFDLAKALLAHGANPNARIAWKEIKYDFERGGTRLPPNILIGRTYLSSVGATPFYLAAKHADLALMRLLVASGADPLISTVQKITPLMAAAGLGFWDGESPGPTTGTPESESLEAVKLCVELGNDVNAATDFGDFPLEGDGMALLHRHPLNFQRLPDTALGDMRWGGSTALHGAAVRGADSIVQFLVEKGAKVDAKNKLGWSPLMIAEGIMINNFGKPPFPSTVALLRKLMLERSVDPELNSQHGRSALAQTDARRPR